MWVLLFLYLLPVFGLAQTGNPVETPKSADDYLIIIEQASNELVASLLCGIEEKEKLLASLEKVCQRLPGASNLLGENLTGTEKISALLELSVKQYEDMVMQKKFWKGAAIAGGVGTIVFGCLLICGGR